MRWSAFRFRVEQFARSLSPARRTEIARRPRFYTLPWLRLTDDGDPDDRLP